MKLQPLVAVIGLLCLPLAAQASARSPAYGTNVRLDGLLPPPQPEYLRFPAIDSLPPLTTPTVNEHSSCDQTAGPHASVEEDWATWVFMLGGIVMVVGTLREYEKWT